MFLSPSHTHTFPLFFFSRKHYLSVIGDIYQPITTNVGDGDDNVAKWFLSFYFILFIYIHYMFSLQIHLSICIWMVKDNHWVKCSFRFPQFPTYIIHLSLSIHILIIHLYLSTYEGLKRIMESRALLGLR